MEAHSDGRTRRAIHHWHGWRPTSRRRRRSSPHRAGEATHTRCSRGRTAKASSSWRRSGTPSRTPRSSSISVQEHAQARSGVGWEDSSIAPEAATLSLPDRTVYAERKGARILQIYAPSAEFVDTVRQAVVGPLELE